MENFKFEDKEVEFWSLSGVVLDQQKYSETHVSSSGGGGYVGPQGGSVSAPSIHSKAVTKHEFWLKIEDGIEKPVQLSGVDVPVRTGHKISVINSKRIDLKECYSTVIVNHTTNEFRLVEDGASLNDKLNLLVSWGRSLFIALIWWAVFIFMFAIAPQSSSISGWLLALSFVSALIALIWSYSSKAKRKHRMQEALTTHIKNLAANALS